MEEAEKMAALKRAYAEIILNTAKEAAARVVASERKALRFQQDLRSTKDEALRMLLRLKQMVDSKTTEAEVASNRQQRRIDELEAQLQEAEGIIVDLREELKQVYHELEKVNKNHLQHLNGRNSKENELSVKTEATVGKLINISEPIVPYTSDSEIETMANSSIDKRLNDTIQDCKCCYSVKNAEEVHGSDLEKLYGQSSNLASIIMQNKEPELYKNGCTQRIRASERNSANAPFTNSVEAEHQHSFMHNEFVFEADEKDEEKCIIPLETIGKERMEETSEEQYMIPTRRLKRRKKKLPNVLLKSVGMEKMIQTSGDQYLLPPRRPKRRRKKQAFNRSSSKDEGKRTVPLKIDGMGIMEDASGGEHEIPAKRQIQRTKKSSLFRGIDKDDNILCSSCPSQPAKSSQKPSIVSTGKTYSVKKNIKAGGGACAPAPRVDIDKGKKTCYGDEVQIIFKKRRKQNVRSRISLFNFSCSPSDQLNKHWEPSIPSANKTYSGNSCVTCADVSSKRNKNEVKMKPSPCLDSGLTPVQSNEDPTLGSRSVVVGIKVSDESRPVCAAEKETEAAGDPVLQKKEDDAADNLEDPVDEFNPEIGNLPAMDSDMKDAEVCKEINRSTNQADTNRLLKYTFQRKRKKELSSNLDENTTPEISVVKRRLVDKEGGAPEPQKCTLVSESSRDSRRLAQVARQLISLSGKRWW